MITRGAASGLLLFFQEEGKGFPDAQGILLDDQTGGTMVNSLGGWAADLDGDGRQDLLVSGNRRSRTLTILYQRTPRVFGSTRAGALGVIPDNILLGTTTPLEILPIDLDEDGDPDLMVPDYDGGTLNIYFGNH